jgi:hypothetical protein
MRDLVDELKKGGNISDVDLNKLFAEKKNKKTDTNDLAYDNAKYVVKTIYEDSPSKSERMEEKQVRATGNNSALTNQLRE